MSRICLRTGVRGIEPRPELIQAMKDAEDKPVAAVERALSILDAFGKGNASLTLGELSERTGLYRSTILRLAKTLEDFGYLTRNKTGAISIGPKPIHLARLFQDSLQPAEIILPALTRLVAATGESAAYSVRFGDKRVCALRVDSPHVIRPHVSPGEAFPLNKGCGGRMFLAFERPFAPEYEKVRRKLVASSAGELGPDMAGVASPVFDASGDLAGVLTITGPHSRFNLAAMRNCEALLISAARDITRGLGGNTQAFDTVLPPSRIAQGPGNAARQASTASALSSKQAQVMRSQAKQPARRRFSTG